MRRHVDIDTMPDTTGSSWGLPTPVWDAVCDALDPVTAVDRPYDHVRIVNPVDDDGMSGTVTHPRPQLDTPDVPDDADVTTAPMTDDDWASMPRNGSTRLPEDVCTALADEIQAFRDNGLTTTRDDLDVVFDSAVYTRSGAGAGVVSVTRSVEDADLYRQFQELMVTLGHADDPDAIVDGYRVTPRDTDLSANALDVGMEATVYKMVPDPHEYWANVDTVDEYIDMRVEHGADRATLEAQDEYRLHFHPDTRTRSLSDDQQAAVRAWGDSVARVVEPHVTVGDAVTWAGVTTVDVAADATVSVEYAAYVGDTIEDTQTTTGTGGTDAAAE